MGDDPLPLREAGEDLDHVFGLDAGPDDAACEELARDLDEDERLRFAFLDGGGGHRDHVLAVTDRVPGDRRGAEADLPLLLLEEGDRVGGVGGGAGALPGACTVIFQSMASWIPGPS